MTTQDFITHEELIYCIKQEYPNLEHGKDFWVGQPVNDTTQLDNAFIVSWSAEVPMPENIEQLTSKYLPIPNGEKRTVMPQLSMVDFRRKLRSIKVVQRYYPDGTPYEELEGIYEEDILEKIDLIADKDLQAEARDYFLYAQYVERTNPWIEILGSMFGLTPEDIDVLWMGDNES